VNAIENEVLTVNGFSTSKKRNKNAEFQMEIEAGYVIRPLV
jgi:uncharacterized FAD-dependent dehydrogenase